IKETQRVISDVVREGKVQYIGASRMNTYQLQKAQQVAEINGWTKFVAMQNHYNLVYREEEREMNPYTKETGVALVPYSPLAAGRLAREWDTDSERMKTDEVAKMKYDSTEETE